MFGMGGTQMTETEALTSIRQMLDMFPSCQPAAVAFAVSALLSRADNAELDRDMLRTQIDILHKTDGKAKK